jgi:hypothetical protein
MGPYLLQAISNFSSKTARIVCEKVAEETATAISNQIK